MFFFIQHFQSPSVLFPRPFDLLFLWFPFQSLFFFSSNPLSFLYNTTLYSILYVQLNGWRRVEHEQYIRTIYLKISFSHVVFLSLSTTLDAKHSTYYKFTRISPQLNILGIFKGNFVIFSENAGYMLERRRETKSIFQISKEVRSRKKSTRHFIFTSKTIEIMAKYQVYVHSVCTHFRYRCGG